VHVNDHSDKVQPPIDVDTRLHDVALGRLAKSLLRLFHDHGNKIEIQQTTAYLGERVRGDDELWDWFRHAPRFAGSRVSASSDAPFPVQVLAGTPQ